MVLSSHPCRALEDALLAGLSRLLWLVLAPALCRPPTSKTMVQWFRCQITSTHWCREALSSTSWGITTIETLISECTGPPHGPEWQGGSSSCAAGRSFLHLHPVPEVGQIDVGKSYYTTHLNPCHKQLCLGKSTARIITVELYYTTWVHPVWGLKHQSLEAKLYA